MGRDALFRETPFPKLLRAAAPLQLRRIALRRPRNPADHQLLKRRVPKGLFTVAQTGEENSSLPVVLNPHRRRSVSGPSREHQALRVFVELVVVRLVRDLEVRQALDYLVAPRR